MSLLMDALKKAEQAKKSAAPEDPPSNSSDTLLTEWNDTVSFPDPKELPRSSKPTSQTPPVEDNFVYTKEWWKTQTTGNDTPSQPALGLEGTSSAKTTWQSDLLTEFKDDLLPSPSSSSWNEPTAASTSVNWNVHHFLQDSIDADNTEAHSAESAIAHSAESAISEPTPVERPAAVNTAENTFVTGEATDTQGFITDTTPEEVPSKIQGFSLREWQHEKTSADSTTVTPTEGEYLFGPSPLEIDLHSTTSEPREGVELSSATRRIFTQDSSSVTEPEAAQRLFAAGTPPPAYRTKILYAFVGVVLIGLGTGGYYYYTLTNANLFLGKTPSQPLKLSDKVVHHTSTVDLHTTKNTKTVEIQQPPKSSISSSPPPTSATETTTQTPSSQKVTNQPSEPTASEKTSPLLSAKTTVAKSEEAPTEEVPKPDREPKPTRSTDSSSAATTKPPKTEQQPPKSNTADTPPASESNPQTSKPGDSQLQLKKSLSQQVNQDIATAYTAFQRGDAKTAEQIYTRTLQQDQTNHDALLGLAAVAVQRGDIPTAQRYYRLLLKLYPQDTYAQVGLLNTLDNRSSDSESQLKLLLEKAPRSAYIHFSLGNLYANQGRWAQAQQAYFEAYRYDNNKADYAYNLAVSLDQLNQAKTALNYYQTALTLGRTQVVSFNLQAIQQRVQTLLNHQ